MYVSTKNFHGDDSNMVRAAPVKTEVVIERKFADSPSKISVLANNEIGRAHV